MGTDIQPPPFSFMLKACVERDWHFILAHCDGEPFLFRESQRLMGLKVYQDGVQEANSVGIEVFTVEKVLEVEVI